MSSNQTKRLQKDIKAIMENTETSGIHYWADENDISKGKALIFGPEDTPYAHGAYFFDLQFNNFPFEPPKVAFKSYYNGIRLHPNLYVDGKVCLSLLGTFSGPSWTATHTIFSIFLAISSILTKQAIQNEPNHEKEIDDIYDQIIEYAAIDGLICDSVVSCPNGFDMFKPVLIQRFKHNYSQLIERVDALIALHGPENIHLQSPNLFKSSLTVNYGALKHKLINTYNSLDVV